MRPIDWRSPRTRKILLVLALSGIVGYGALLRFNALFATHGPYAQPAWARAAQPVVTTLHHAIGPHWTWPHWDDLYAGGDPQLYLKFAREMRHFYQPHVREPAYLASVKAGLLLSGDADVGISLVSIFYSLLLIVATYLLGAQLFSPAVGLAAAAALAVEHEMISWSFGGWRDDAFTAIALIAVWLWLRVASAPSIRGAIWAGLVTGVACLTRLTAPFMLAPVMIAVAIGGARPRRERLMALVAGGVVVAVLVLPYLIACAIEYGDPFYAINYHTQFYLNRSGQQARIMPATSFILDAWRAGPIDAIDTALEGAFVYPFTNKWRGLNTWMPGLGTLLAPFAMAGLIGWIWTPGRRVLVATIFCSLVPYLATWKIVGGSEWRFTVHTYPLYLLAAFSCIAGLVALLRRPTGLRTINWRRTAGRAALTMAVIALAIGWTYKAPYWIAREALTHGRSAIINANRRDRWLLTQGWSDLTQTANVIARFSIEPTAIVRLPLPERRAYELVLRADPVPVGAEPAQRVRVFFNSHPVAVVQLTWDPQSVGRHTIQLPKEYVVDGANELSLQADVSVDATLVADRYPEVAHAGQIGFRLWYVMVTASGEQ